ncbi:MAG: hypothetical protein HY270_09930 [Deltaproteobacteria bacterium]|nr:hypothetical protein [Deltaproteobacteria bacterium]
MARLLVSDTQGYFTVDVETNGPVLGAALDDRMAEPVVASAMTVALAALAEGGGWPELVLHRLRNLMAEMQHQLASPRAI